MPTFQRIIPLLVCEDIQAEHDFLVDAFGFAPRGVDVDDAGEPIHGEVFAGDLPIWLHRVSPEFELASARDTKFATGGLVVHVDDVDAHYEHSRAAGAHVDSAPTDQPYGQREYGARDVEGHRWWFATPRA